MGMGTHPGNPERTTFHELTDSSGFGEAGGLEEGTPFLHKFERRSRCGGYALAEPDKGGDPGSRWTVDIDR